MRFCRDKKVPVYITGKEELTTEDVSRLLFESEIFNSKYEKNEDYYHNKHKILDRTYEDDSKPNSKVCVGYPNYICQIRNGYFSSSPLSLDSENKDYLEEVSKVLEELDNFVYLKDKDGTYNEDKTDHTFSHTIDALKYAYGDVYKSKKLSSINLKIGL